MARNQEKAQSLLNRYLSMKQEGKKIEKRPYLAQLEKSLPKAEKWRIQILREIGKKVIEIQNTKLGPQRTRELNDEINKLIREKKHWERHIKSLGGADYSGKEIEGIDSGNVIVHGDYYYFGASKELPGVRDLLKPQRKRGDYKSKYKLQQQINADYYGIRDEEDDEIEELELEIEQRERELAHQQWLKENPHIKNFNVNNSDDEEDDEDNNMNDDELFKEIEPIPYVDVPTDDDIKKIIFQKKKEEILQKHGLK
eukprot:TRINITY_DN305_c0_g1_i1.p1 TRINITY_DN305_c0_g1~~TRINITY_DN305_c0_g1_i1.p1  ORF type:complete len:255 (-),score=106.36 TRINITY_DN305_c0_g1_i1:144-908(-)